MTVLFLSIVLMSAVIASKWEKVTNIFKTIFLYISHNVKFLTV